jgi:hypothetical protein
MDRFPAGYRRRRIDYRCTAGYLRAGLREVDESGSRAGATDLPCRTFQTVPIGELVSYRIPLVANPRRFTMDYLVKTEQATNFKETQASAASATLQKGCCTPGRFQAYSRSEGTNEIVAITCRMIWLLAPPRVLPLHFPARQ